MISTSVQYFDSKFFSKKSGNGEWNSQEFAHTAVSTIGNFKRDSPIQTRISCQRTWFQTKNVLKCLIDRSICEAKSKWIVVRSFSPFSYIFSKHFFGGDLIVGRGQIQNSNHISGWVQSVKLFKILTGGKIGRIWLRKGGQILKYSHFRTGEKRPNLTQFSQVIRNAFE